MNHLTEQIDAKFKALGFFAFGRLLFNCTLVDLPNAWVNETYNSFTFTRATSDEVYSVLDLFASLIANLPQEDLDDYINSFKN